MWGLVNCPHTFYSNKRVYLHTCYILFLNNKCIQRKGQVQLFFYQQFEILNADILIFLLMQKDNPGKKGKCCINPIMKENFRYKRKQYILHDFKSSFYSNNPA